MYGRHVAVVAWMNNTHKEKTSREERVEGAILIGMFVQANAAVNHLKADGFQGSR